MSMRIPPPGAPGAPVPGPDGSRPAARPPAAAPQAPDLDLARLNRMAAAAAPSAGDRAGDAVAATASAVLADPGRALAAQANLSPEAVAWLLRD